jgi:hypothetical protein
MQTVISKYSRLPRRREVEATKEEEGGMKARYGIPSKSS